MSLGVFAYTATVLIFTGLALLLYLAMRFCVSPKNARLSRTDWKIILLTVTIITVAASPAEWTALTLRAWVYNPERTLDTTFLGAEVEAYLFAMLVALVVSMATILYARREDRKRETSSL